MATARIEINSQEYTEIPGINDTNYINTDGDAGAMVAFADTQPLPYTVDATPTYKDDSTKGHATLRAWAKSRGDMPGNYVTAVY